MFTTDEEKLLLDLFHLYAPSGGEKPVLDFIKSVLINGNIPFKEDDNGNIYCINHKDQPLLSAHTDCVGKAESGAYVKLIDIYNYGSERIMKGLGNIGGDDKCGVFLILLYLLSGRPINAVFSICEEIGGAEGIKHLLPQIKEDEIFKTIPYCLVLDRKSCGDIICANNDYGTEEFQKALIEVGKPFGYHPETGSCSDMNTIKEVMNGANLSVAYYNPHSTTEYVVIDELWNTWQYVQKIISDLPRNIPMKNRTQFLSVVPEVPKDSSLYKKTKKHPNNYNGYYDDYLYGYYY